MIKILKLTLISLLIIFYYDVNAQHRKSIEYCFYEKNQLIYVLKNYSNYPPCDKRGKIRFVDKDTVPFENNNFVLPDSIYGLFKIVGITSSSNNFSLKKNRLVKIKMYSIDIICLKENSPNYIRLLSIEQTSGGKKIKVGDTLSMSIFPFFSYDRFSSIMDGEGNEINRFPNIHARECFLFENIWVVGYPFVFRNLFETPNLKGLHYVR